jgi:hypothetical protein
MHEYITEANACDDRPASPLRKCARRELKYGVDHTQQAVHGGMAASWGYRNPVAHAQPGLDFHPVRVASAIRSGDPEQDKDRQQEPVEN